MAVLSGFKDFIARGNVVDLAVGVVMGSALTAIVNSIVDALINPLIAVMFGAPDIDNAGMFAIGHTNFYPGMVISAIIKFLIIAFAVYFFIVVPFGKLSAKLFEKDEAPAPEEKLLTEIRDLLAKEQRNWPYAGGN